MSSSINLSLTDELRRFIDSHCGDGTLYATPSEFLRSVLREKKEREEADALRESVIEGYHDLLTGRTIEYKGSIRDVLKEARARDKNGW